MKLFNYIIDWIDVRLGVKELWRENMTGYLVPGNINKWYSLGTVLLVLFGLQFLTGILLLIYYVPAVDKAFASVEKIVNEVPYGWLVRNLHAVGSNLIVVVLLLHMLSVLFMGSYKKPRELTWLSGFIIFNISMVLCLTGYLLPWSQLSFWATTVATDAAGAVPVIGDQLVEFLRGGPSVGEQTLGRFFALHVVVLPLAFLGLVGFHLFCIRKIGISRPPFGEKARPAQVGKEFKHEKHEDGIPFFPDYTIEEMSMVCFFLAILVAVTFFAPQIFIPPDALVPADPFNTPENIKPEWYFLWAYQTLKIFPSEFLGLAAQGGLMTFLALLPFIDRGEERRPAKRPVFVAIYVLSLFLLIAISVWGHYS